MRMPLYFTAILLFPAGLLTNAQINKGDKLLGGSFSGQFNQNNTSFNDGTGSNIGVNPSFGVAVKNNFVVGVRGSIGYYYSKNTPENSTGPTTKDNNFSALFGLYAKKYATLKSNVGYFLDHAIAPGYFSYISKSVFNNATTKTKTTGFQVNYQVTPGIYYQIKPNLLLEASIGGAGVYYSKGKRTSTNTISNKIENTGVSITFLQSFNVGVNFILNKGR
jgi:hypothetical protein